MTDAPPTAPRDDDRDRARHRRLRELFDEGLELPGEARRAWLESRITDPAERAALQRLFDADAGVGPLELPAEELVERIDIDPETWSKRLVGTSVGGFRLLRPIGQGGMGAVFLAAREGTDFEQHAAVKLLRRGLFSPTEQALFRRERRALARLAHADITRLIDGGVTPTGIPYLVMEWVDGIAITDHARERALDLRARLALVARVCRAVGAAHRQLVVHRDIKPSNILVTPDGQPKLLDFGIAKLLDEGDDDGTRSGMAMLTRSYAAPEQLQGGTISTATDVHALGVLLHELLLGERPDDVTRRPSTRVAADATVRHDVVASPARLRAALRGDLDNVLMKALQPDPDLRYGNASELADDIERFLSGRPVDAHPPSAWYRTRKFVQRHRGGVALTVAMVLALVASLGLAAWQAREARIEAREARAQARRADEIRIFVESLFMPLSEGVATARAPTLRELLARGEARIARQYPDEPAVRADLLSLFVRIRDALGETATLRTLATDAVTANVAAYGPGDPRTLDARELRVRVLRKLGQYDEARVELERARRDLATAGLAGQPLAKLIDAQVALGKETGAAPDAIVALSRESLAAREADPAAAPTDLATARNNLGAALLYAGDPGAAMPHLDAAQRAFVAAHGDNIDAVNAEINAAIALADLGRWTEASSRFADADARFRTLDLGNHPSRVNLLLRWCGVEIEREAIDTATRLCDDGAAMAEAVHGRTHRQYVGVLMRQARLAALRGDAATTDARFSQARALAATLASDEDRALVDGAIAGQVARVAWQRGDDATVRDAALDVLRSPHPRLGDHAGLAFLLAAYAAEACAKAPSPRCPDDLAERARRLLDAPIARDHALRLPAHVALARAGALAPAAAIAAIDADLAAVGAEYGPDHSVRALALRERARRR